MASPTAALAGRATLGLALAAAHRAAQRRAASATPAVGPGIAALLAVAPSAMLVARAARRPSVRWRRARPATYGLLVIHVLSGAVIEEVVWRGVLTRPGRPRVVTLGSALGFVAAHVPRDGRAGSRSHAINAAAWTVSASAGQRLRWPVLAHAGYNVAAHLLVLDGGHP